MWVEEDEKVSGVLRIGDNQFIHAENSLSSLSASISMHLLIGWTYARLLNPL